jgi:hypothetical protein
MENLQDDKHVILQLRYRLHPSSYDGDVSRHSRRVEVQFENQAGGAYSEPRRPAVLLRRCAHRPPAIFHASTELQMRVLPRARHLAPPIAGTVIVARAHHSLMFW